MSNSINFTEQQYSSGINIEVNIEGVQDARTYVFFSHYDIAKSTRQGANDNSSSVIVMLHVALYFTTHKPACNISIVFNDTEEILGGVFNNSLNFTNQTTIVQSVGSFQYLKGYCDKSKISGVFVLELSGIGDSIFIANKSGAIECNEVMVDYLLNIAQDNNISTNVLPVLNSDMLSVFMEKMRGVVIGAIPDSEAKLYLKRVNNLAQGEFPATWKKIHSPLDNHLTIEESAMQMVYDFVLLIINSLTLLRD